jgi:molecular chaperone HscB
LARRPWKRRAPKFELDALNDQLNLARNKVLQRIEQLLDEKNDPKAASQQVRGLMFIERFGHDVENRLEQLGQ